MHSNYFIFNDGRDLIKVLHDIGLDDKMNFFFLYFNDLFHIFSHVPMCLFVGGYVHVNAVPTESQKGHSIP